MEGSKLEQRPKKNVGTKTSWPKWTWIHRWTNECRTIHHWTPSWPKQRWINSHYCYHNIFGIFIFGKRDFSFHFVNGVENWFAEKSQFSMKNPIFLSFPRNSIEWTTFNWPMDAHLKILFLFISSLQVLHKLVQIWEPHVKSSSANKLIQCTMIY